MDEEIKKDAADRFAKIMNRISNPVSSWDKGMCDFLRKFEISINESNLLGTLHEILNIRRYRNSEMIYTEISDWSHAAMVVEELGMFDVIRKTGIPGYFASIVFIRGIKPDKESIKRALEENVIRPGHPRGFGKVSHKKMCEWAGVEVKEKGIRISKSWNYHPMTGEKLK